MNKTLLAITTCNKWEYTEKMLKSLEKCEGGFDIILVDDYSTDGTIEYAKQYGIKVLTKPSPQGSTHSWNMIYHYFKFSDYDNLFIANNDVLIPNGCMTELIKNIKDGCVTMPVTTFYGSGDHDICTVNTYHPELHKRIPAGTWDNYQEVQDFVGVSKIDAIEKRDTDYAAFFFGFNKSLIKQEWYGNLFFPYNINIHQERDMKGRFGCVVVPTAYVYHLKGGTLIETDNSRNDLNLYHDEYKRPDWGQVVICWYKKDGKYTIDNLYAHPLEIAECLLVLSDVGYGLSTMLLEKSKERIL